jgi:hypothetical protein
MYTIYLDGIGEVTLRKNVMHSHKHKTCILGHDNNRVRIGIIVDKLIMPSNPFDDCGYCHITSYTRFGITTKCNIYAAIR